jgi:hypothetical protein
MIDFDEWYAENYQLYTSKNGLALAAWQAAAKMERDRLVQTLLNNLEAEKCWCEGIQKSLNEIDIVLKQNRWL